MSDAYPQQHQSAAEAKATLKVWAPPSVEEMPRLNELTLQSSIPGGGGPGGTVF